MDFQPPVQASASEITEKLRKEEDQLSQLKDCLKRSKEQKETMLGILDSFQKRLGNLDATVLPLYEQTGRLQRRQQNIGKTLKQIDATVSFYSTANEMDATIRDTQPSEDLERYMARMGKLREAMKFFASDPSSAVQLESTRSSYELGCSSLEREFRDVLMKGSTPLKPVQVIELLDENFGTEPLERQLKSTECLKTADVEKLKTICEWLLGHTGSADFLAAYSDIRAPLMLRTLRQINNETRKNTAANTSGLAGKDSPKNERKSSAAIMKGAVVKKLSSMTHAGDKNYKRSNTSALDYGMELGGDREADSFLTAIGSFNVLFQMEQHLMEKIVCNRREEGKIQRALVIKSLEFVLKQAEVLVEGSRRVPPVLRLLPVAKYLHAHKQQLDGLTKNSSSDLHSKFIQLVQSVDAMCVKGLEDFVEVIKSDQDKFIPRDGTVHQVTSNTLSLLKQLMDQKESVNLVLVDASPSHGSEQQRNAVPKLFARILSALGLCLCNKAENYQDQYLKAIFMLNNYNHIYKTLQGCGILKVVCEQNREVENYYLEQVQNYKQQYLGCWVRALSTFADLIGRGNDSPILGGHHMADKEKEALKNAFVNFNRELELLTDVQREYSVPDQDLSGQMKREAKEILLARYQTLFSNYKSTSFSRNPEKYVRYTPDDVAIAIDRLFDTPA